MPRQNGRMTLKESRFIAASSRGAHPQEAARRAGYAHPEIAGYAVARRPDVQAAVREQQTHKLFTVGLPIAVDTLISIAQDTKQPGNSRIGAAKEILKYTIGGGEDAVLAKAPEDMTGDELQRAIDALKKKASDLATPVIEGAVRTTSAQNVMD